MNTPLVSIGIPVRNGGLTISLIIENLLSQTYKNMEVIISDNNSTDDTSSICAKYSDNHTNIFYFKQSRTLTAVQNFHFVLQNSRGEFFAWAAHDDLRTSNWIEILVNCLKGNPNSCMAHSDYAVINTPSPSTRLIDLKYPLFFGKKTLSISQSFKSRVHCIHTYGLFRSHLLKLYSFRHIDFSGDHALVAFMSFIGDFVYCKGAYFYYYYPLQSKSANQHALEVGGKPLSPFARLRLSWFTSRVLSDAIRINGGERRPFTFLPMAIWIFYKSVFYGMMPLFIKHSWKNFKASRS